MAPHMSEISIFACKYVIFIDSSSLEESTVGRNKISASTCTYTQDLISHYNVFLRVATSLLYKKLPGKSINRWPLTL